MWTVKLGKEIIALYSKEEDARYLADWLEKRDMPKGPAFVSAWALKTGETRFKVVEVYEDCYIQKIKDGWTTFRVELAKDGTVLEASKYGVVPSTFGFKSVVIRLSSTRGKVIPILTYVNLCRNKEEAVELAQKERIKRLLDDIWQEKEREAAIYNEPTQFRHKVIK